MDGLPWAHWKGSLHSESCDRRHTISSMFNTSPNFIAPGMEKNREKNIYKTCNKDYYNSLWLSD